MQGRVWTAVGVLVALVVATGTAWALVHPEASPPQRSEATPDPGSPVLSALPTATRSSSAARTRPTAANTGPRVGSTGAARTHPTAANTGPRVGSTGAARTRPTAANTGPRGSLGSTSAARVMSRGRCQGKRVRGQVRLESRSHLGRLFRFTDCAFPDGILVNIPGSENRMPTIELTRVRLNRTLVIIGPTRLEVRDSTFLEGAFMATDSNDLGARRPMPIRFVDSYLYQPQGNPANGDHTEALLTLGWGSGYRFVNTAFVQQGPRNDTATATINFHGMDSVFDRCWFDWVDGKAAWYTIYAEGERNVIKDSRIVKGLAGWVYPDSNPQARYQDNRTLGTGAPLRLP